MLLFVPFLIMALIMMSRFLRTKRTAVKRAVAKEVTAKEAFRAYYDKYKASTYSGPGRYNRAAFRLVNDTPVFLEDNPCTSAYISQEEFETLSSDTEVFVMVVATSSLFGYTSYVNKKAKQAFTLVFRAEPFYEVGRFGKGFRSSWLVNGENFHVLDDHFMNVDQIENFKAQAMADYEFDEKY